MNEIISLKIVSELTGLSETTIDRYEKKGLFPKRLRISARRIAWFKKDIENWLNSLNRGINRK